MNELNQDTAKNLTVTLSPEEQVLKDRFDAEL